METHDSLTHGLAPGSLGSHNGLLTAGYFAQRFGGYCFVAHVVVRRDGVTAEQGDAELYESGPVGFDFVRD